MTGRAMFRYAVMIDDEPHTVALTGDPVAAAASDRLGYWAVEFWAEHDNGQPAANRTFQVFGTGHLLPDGARWIATCPRVDGLVRHLFEVTG